MNTHPPLSDLSTVDMLLDTEELLLANKKHSLNKLVFGVLLKYFQLECHFPSNENRPPEELIVLLAKQLININSTNEVLKNFDWGKRNLERFRSEIRKFLSFKTFRKKDGDALVAWLVSDVLKEGITLEKSEEMAIEFLKYKKIELPTPYELKKYVRAAYAQFEKQFFNRVESCLSDEVKAMLTQLLQHEDEQTNESPEDTLVQLKDLKKDPKDVSLKSIESEIKKLKCLEQLGLPKTLFLGDNQQLLDKYYIRIMSAFPSEILKYSTTTRYALMAIFCYAANQRITDTFIKILIRRIELIETNAEHTVATKYLKQLIKVDGKMDILLKLANASVDSPEGVVQDVIYPQVKQETLKKLIKELQHRGDKWFNCKVKEKMGSMYSHYHRKLLLMITSQLDFNTNNPELETLLKAVEYINQHTGKEEYYEQAEEVPIDGLISSDWQPLVFDDDSTGDKPLEETTKINRYYYELAVFNKFCKLLRCKNIYVDGALDYRNPEQDLPPDWDENKEQHYKNMGLPLDPNEMINDLQSDQLKNMKMLNDLMPSNEKVKIITKKGAGWIKISPSLAQEKPKNLELLHREIERRWPSLSLLDVLKEVEFLVGFTTEIKQEVSKKVMEENEFRRRLLLILYGLGTNMGIKAISKGNEGISYDDLMYIKHRYVNKVGVKEAIKKVINYLLSIRDPKIWGEATTGCACDSTLVRVMDQNLFARRHPRYREHGIMIYWHVDTQSLCIYSQVKTCLSSEVSSMMEGILRHDTEMELDTAYVDTHGASTVGFGFSHLLHFGLLPRFKNIYSQKLYLVNPEDRKNYPNLTLVLKNEINWDLIRDQYDEMVKYAVSLKLGITNAEVILKRFSKDNYDHPVYRAICELGKAVKTIFLCRYLASEDLRIEINAMQNVVERVNGFMDFMFFGKLGRISTNQSDEQELIVSCLHLLQVCMSCFNTILIQTVLAEPGWKALLNEEDRRALSTLIHAHLNPYGLFPLNMEVRILTKPTNQKKDRFFADLLEGLKEKSERAEEAV